MARIDIECSDGITVLSLTPESQAETDLLEMFVALDRQVVCIHDVADTRPPARLNA